MKFILGDSRLYHGDILIQELRTEYESGTYETGKLLISLDNAEPVPEFDIEATTEYLIHVLTDLDLEIGRCIHDKMQDTANELMPIRYGLEVIINMLK